VASDIQQIITVISEQSQLLKECLRHSSLADLESTIQVAALTRQVDMCLEMEITERCLVEDGKLQTRTDLAECLTFLRTLQENLQKYRPTKDFAENNKGSTKRPVTPSRPQTPPGKNNGLLTPETMDRAHTANETSPTSTVTKRIHVENAGVHLPLDVNEELVSADSVSFTQNQFSRRRPRGRKSTQDP